MSQKSKIFAIICIFTYEFLILTVMRIIQKLLFAALAVLLIASCSPYSKLSEEQRVVVDEALSKAYVRAIEKPDLKLDITHIIPRGMPSKISTGEFTLRLEGDVVTTRLPFIGVSHQPMYAGADEISIVFNEEKVDLRKDFSKAKKGVYKYKFKGGEGYYKWEVSLVLYDNGKATIDCNCTDGRSMSYYADIVLLD